MLSFLSKSSICNHLLRKTVNYSAVRLFANAKESESIKSTETTETKEQSVEKTTSKKDSELPDFPEFPHIRANFEEGIRSREYLKNRPTEKRIDMLKQKSGSVVYFDDEEFKYYFPHEYALCR